jgi:hypothetical protein
MDPQHAYTQFPSDAADVWLLDEPGSIVEVKSSMTPRYSSTEL